MRESFPTATTLVHSIIVSSMDYLGDLPTSVLNADATRLIPWSLRQDHSTSVSKPSMAPISFRAESYVAPNSLDCRHLSPSIHLLCSFWNMPKESHLKACVFSLPSGQNIPSPDTLIMHIHRPLWQGDFARIFYMKDHFLPWPSYPLTHRQSHTGCL